MPPRLRSLLAQIGSFVLAGVLLYLALRGVDLGAVVDALGSANYAWLLPLIAIALASHWLRAWRWQILIRALPDLRDASEERVPSVWSAFCSVMIGYMVNYAAPRLGEVARTANLSAQGRLGFSSLFGTVVVERILDVVVLVGSLLSVFILLFDRAGTLGDLFVEPIVSRAGQIPAVGIGLIALGVAVLLLLVFRRILRDEDAAIARFWTRRARPVLSSFRDGLATVLRSKNRSALLISTIGIWFLYLLMAYVPFEMLGMADTYSLSLGDAWTIMILGALGVAIPSPGGTGSYHYITIQTLVHLFAVSQESAATYAVLSHAALLILYVTTGAVCLMLQGSDLRSLRRRTSTARHDEPA